MAKHKRRGMHSKLDVADRLLLACKYWCQCVTFLSVGNEFSVAKSTAPDITVWVENELLKNGKSGLSGKKLLTGENLEILLVDVTESPVERPSMGKNVGILEKRSATPLKPK